MPNWVWIIPFYIAGAAVIWLSVCWFLRKIAKMNDSLDLIDTGSLVRESRWGSANVNGVGMNNCVRLAEYERGYMLRIMRLFGKGRVWLPKDEVEIGPIEHRVWYRGGEVRSMRSPRHRILLGKGLTRFVESGALQES